MAFTQEQLQTVMQNQDENSYIEALRQLLGYAVKERDPVGSRFWYLRPGSNADEARETCPIAVGFYDELADLTPTEAKSFLSAKEQQQEIYGHWTNRILEDQPVIYLLLPNQAVTGTVPLILPSEGGLRAKQIQTFARNDAQLVARLNRLRQDELPIATMGLTSVPLVEWVFYEPIKTAQELAQLLAKAARNIEQVIPVVYKQEQEDGYLHHLLKSFQRELLPALKLSADNEKDYSFADIYAQTIAYALFTARVFSYVKDKREGRISKPTHFNREKAWEQLPETNPFLRKLFKDVSERKAEELGDDLIGAIAEIFRILRVAKMDAILSDFEMKMNREDIVIRFYEDFLAAYKPQMRERRGVYYTPEPVVSYMVRSVDILVKEKFNKPLGLADPEVMILDPACGTGTFLLWICQLIYQRFQESSDALTEGLEDKSWSGYVKERLLPRIFGFELLMAPYAIAHLKLGLFLEETGYLFDSGQRLGVYLTNTLDDAKRRSETLFKEFIAEESDAAVSVKLDIPVMVVIGNPPYSVNSANNSEWATNLVRNSYYPKDEIKEQNPKLLLDDYVKFIRFSQWRIDKTGKGILSFVTNHGYLDNPTFRGMRQSLAKSFNCIHVLDLHGNSKKKETALDRAKDENVFDIQQGVAVCIMVKDENPIASEINHAHLYGTRGSKYEWLLNHNVLPTSTDWTNLLPQKPFSLFIPQNNELLPEYSKGWKITNLMPVNATGIKTHRDHFAYDFDYTSLFKRIEEFRDTNISDEVIREKYGLEDTRDWKLSQKRKELSSRTEWIDYLIKSSYRPFDSRSYYHHEDIAEYPRKEVMRHMEIETNIGFHICRQVISDSWQHTLVTNYVADDCYVSNKTRERGFTIPLYIYPDIDKPQELQEQRRSNFSEEFLIAITNKLGYLPTAEAIFYYIYAVFHSPTYRTRYAEFLKIDFPRVPLTSNNKLFCQLSTYGEELVALHLMKSPKLDTLITNFIETGGDRVVDPGHPKYEQNSVKINKKGDKFTGVPEEVWNFYVGGYQVCQKWLKDRKGRTLTPEDIQHYQRIVVALKETIKLMQLIDEAIPE